MQDSRLRTNLGAITMILALVVGYSKGSFIWGVGIFIALNLIIAPIITLLERNNED